MRTDLQRLEDRAKIAELLKKGYRQAGRIATILNTERDGDAVSPSLVIADIKSIKEEYKKAQVEDYDVARKEAIDRLFGLMVTAGEGYSLSQKPKVTVESTVILTKDQLEQLVSDGLNISNEEDVGQILEAKVRTELRPEGNHAFIQQMIQIEDKITKIVGIDAPSKIALTDPSGEKELGSPLNDLLLEMNRSVAPKQLSGFLENEDDDDDDDSQES